jgi:hypothetical protein
MDCAQSRRMKAYALSSATYGPGLKEIVASSIVQNRAPAVREHPGADRPEGVDMDESTVDVELWLPVVKYERSYEVSSYGRVRSIDRVVTNAAGHTRLIRGRLLSPARKSQGHLHVNLYVNGVPWTSNIHQLVLIAFIGPCPPGMECCHNDGNPSNNHLDNLRWDTRSANNLDRIRHGTDSHKNLTHCPRHHKLIAPNLVVSTRLNNRSCLACDRAKANVKFAERQGRALDFIAVADRHYKAIMAGRAPGRSRQRLNDLQKKEICQRYVSGKAQQKDMAIEYGVGRRWISQIVQNRDCSRPRQRS